MKRYKILRSQYLPAIVISALFGIGLINCSMGQEPGPDRPGVPYFEISSPAATEAFPLLSTNASVQIAGVIAHVTVSQVYRNRGTRAIEAVYVFPGSTRAAVHALNMKIGERTIRAVIEEREKARNAYTRAVNQGHTASLLEQERPNVFRMSVGNILPGDLVEVEMQYTEHIVPVNGIYEFVYPTVVGPRYSGNTESGSGIAEWNSNPYLPEGDKPAYDFNLECDITSGIPVKHVNCPSHKANVVFKDRNAVRVTLDQSEIAGGNRDFILRYRLGGNEIESGLWLYSDGKENFFMATIQPPQEIKSGMIPPREYIFIVDVSGSMHGFPLDVSKKLIGELLGGLKSTDRFNILFFAGGSNLFADQSVPANEGNIGRAIKMLDSQSGGGGTELLPALKRALAMDINETYARTFVIATDGYITVEKEAFSLIKSSLGEASFFAFGIGTSVNRYLIEGLAHAGAGEGFIVTNESDAKKKAPEFLKYISTPLLTDIKIGFNDFDVYDVEPRSIPDIFSSRPVVIFGKYRGNPSGNIELTGNNGNGRFIGSIQAGKITPGKQNQAIKYLWAREKIRMTDDLSGNEGNQQEGIKQKVLQLGLQYNLLTAYTSFIAIDSEVRNENGTFTTVREPLPLPQGVSNYAGGVGYATMAPGLIGGDRKCSGLVMKEVELADSEDEVPLITETVPAFPGGEKALKRFINANLRMPEDAANNRISGKVVLEFTVNPDGSLSDITVVRSLGFGCDEEAIRLVRLMPAWIPGKQRGIVVKAKVSLPFYF
ncbi:MAG: TonB family protein [Bacteroidota bacterium]